MKLIFCPYCRDIRKLQLKVMTYCNCGKSYGQYLDNHKAEMNKEAIPVGIGIRSFYRALNHRPILTGYLPESRIEAFLIEDNCPTISIIDDDPENN
jgi:hypothetical protein